MSIDKLLPQGVGKMVDSYSTVATLGFGMSLLPEQLLVELEDEFLQSGQPNNLRLILSGGAGNQSGHRGIDRLAHPGLLESIIASHLGSSPKIANLISENKISAHLLPQGIISQNYRQLTSGKPGLLTKLGLGTFVDPRISGSQANEMTKDSLVDFVQFNHEDYLFYKNEKIDFALLRGTYADPNGNIIFSHEVGPYEALDLAMATKNSGGKVIVQVLDILEENQVNANEVVIPGIFVDHIIIAKEAFHEQSNGIVYDPALSNEIRIDKPPHPLPFNIRKIIARRASLELTQSDTLNLGFGLAESLVNVLYEEKVANQVTLTLDMGQIGGVPSQGVNYGSSYNAQAIIGHNDMMSFYEGGGLDIAFLSFSEIDQKGNVNVSKFGDRIVGPGGFMNIAHATKKLVFVGTFTAKAKLEIANEELKIEEEGKFKKFVEEVKHITFSAEQALSKGQKIKYITERCIFELTDKGLKIIEIAPGIDLERDILEQMAFVPLISENLQETDHDIYQEIWGQLKKHLNDN